MRQAGRYLPEYRALRAKHDFWELVRTPELAVELSLQPVRRFGMDAAILFSDILIALDAMGARVRYEEGGPRLGKLVRAAADLAFLKEVDPERDFGYVAEAVSGLCRALHPNTAVIGFAGAPFTLAAYLVEGKPAQDVRHLKSLAAREPALYAELAERIADAVAGLLQLQARAGADVLQLFDTWAWHLAPEEYAELALPYTRRVIEQLSGLPAPVILYVRNSERLLELAGRSGCQVLSIDSSISLGLARQRLEGRVALQGNFDPSLLTSPAERIRCEVRRSIEEMGGAGYIVNLGQGIGPETPIEGVAALVKAVQEGAP
jgi:uroporphyrinogen decarboxylase